MFFGLILHVADGEAMPEKNRDYIKCFYTAASRNSLCAYSTSASYSGLL
jgi:hypothetical protein